MEYIIERAARTIHAGHCCPCDSGGCDEPDPADYNAARALAEAGLLAPSPLREEWGVDCYLGFEPEAYLERRNAEKHLAYEGGNLLRRYVTDWEEA